MRFVSSLDTCAIILFNCAQQPLFFLDAILWEFSTRPQEDPSGFENQHTMASELPSLHAPEPPSLRLPAANCSGGIRQAQTISWLFLLVFYSCSLTSLKKVSPLMFSRFLHLMAQSSQREVRQKDVTCLTFVFSTFSAPCHECLTIIRGVVVENGRLCLKLVIRDNKKKNCRAA